VSLIRAVTAGTLVGVVTAFGIFVTSGPDNLGRAAAPAAPTFAPVPTPTVTQLADCEKPAVLKKGICVTTKVVAAVGAPASSGSRTTAPRTAPAPAPAATTTTTAEDQQDEPGDDRDDDHDGDDGEH
jgi:hypothetical protein